MRMFRAVLAFTLLLSVVAAGSAAVPASAARSTYIVVLDDSVSDVQATARALASGAGGELGFVYHHALKGFSAELTARAASALAANPRVSFVEADQEVSLADTSAVPVPTGIDRVNADQNTILKIDGNDERVTGAVVAVIDTGIDFDHPDLNVNTTKSVNCAGGGPFKSSCSTGAGDDDNGHGTHVAGTIGALDNGPDVGDIHVVGVAPGVEQWAVKVLRSDGSGYISWIVAGIDYVTANASTVDVANMSLGCECSSAAMDDAIERSVAAGVTYAVAAGNSAKDASTFSPAKHPDVITVSALADFDGEPGGLIGDTSGNSAYCRADVDDTLADFSNFGSLIEVTAPGVCILSTVPGGGYATYSGTSMASPHVAGAAALLASSGMTSPANIRNTLISTGNATDWTDEVDGTEEPRIDVTNTNVFKPSMSGTSGGGGEADTTAPAAPANLSATAGDGQVSLDWSDNAESDLASYNVYRSQTSGSYDLTAPLTSVTSSQHLDSTVTNGTTYYYVVTAVDTSGNESAPSNEVTPTPDSTGSTSPEGTYVGDLDGTATSNKSLWNATVWIRVIHVDSAGVTGVNGVAVEGTWDPATGQNGKTTSCATADHPVTGEAGWCSVNSGNFMKSTSSVRWTVTSLGGAAYTGAPAGASDPDGDSDLKSVTVNKP